MKFLYYELRPCVDYGDHVVSYLGDPEPIYGDPGTLGHTAGAALAEAERHAAQAHDAEVFWTLYGRDEEGQAVAIGDFETYDAAFAVLRAILMPLREAANALADLQPGVMSGWENEFHALAAKLEATCNVSTNEERL